MGKKRRSNLKVH